ncbi:ATP-binding protein [Belliella kenyensis]|uniref:histidine kinase n=1 Tax=Belliella kenyensis TaxID=1472724 RepID=A0ABV8EMA1_9BACT|nr:ATP-binding protein [Belliella kenyensis]MCH7402989.1 response regulator [Belliella kenyensis]MDN3605025.1 response regulator [Belliella kenyensis]
MKDRGINNTFKKVIYESSDMVFLADDTYPYNIFYSNLAFDNSIGDYLLDKSLVGLGLDVNSYIFKEELLISFQSSDYKFQIELPNQNGENYFLFYNGKEIKKHGFPSSQDSHLFFDSGLDMIAIGKNNFLTWVNSKTLKVLGYTQEELVNVDLCQFFHPEDLSDFRLTIAGLNSENSGYDDLSVRILSKNHGYRLISWNVKFVDGSFYASGRDVTERRRDFQLFKNFTNYVPGAFFKLLINNTGEITFPYFSPSVFELFGINDTNNESIDLGVIVSKIHHEDTANVISTAMMSSKSTKPWECDFRIKGKDEGSIKWIRVHAQLAEVRHMKLVWYGYLSDVTSSKMSEQTLHLQKEIAENSSRIKSEFLSTISHDLRTPLNAITGSIYTLLQDVHTPAQKAAFDTINFSVDNLIIMINDLLDFQKIEAGKLSLDLQPMELAGVVKQVINSFESHALESRNTLRLHFDDAANLVVLGDKVRLTQVLNNLISNALKFTKNGQVELKVQLKSNKSDYSIIYFEVKDTGIGIAEEDMEKIFQDFDQLQQTFSKKYGGTGLGLSISKKLLEQMDSRIEVTSQLGVGSIFFFEIAFENVNKEMLRPNSYSKPEEVKLSQVSVLMAEDNDVNALVLGKILKKWGYEFDRVTNGVEALEAIGKKEYDIILMDIQMPLMDGLECTSKIKEISNTPVIALTAAIEQEVIKALEAVGFDEYVSKPIDADELHQKINDLLVVTNL